MALTREVTMNHGDWTAVNLGAVSYIMVQLKTTGPVLVQVADTKPAPSSIEGVMLAREHLEELILPGLSPGNFAWVRSFENEANSVASYQV